VGDRNVFLGLNVSPLCSNTSTHRFAVKISKIMRDGNSTYQPTESGDSSNASVPSNNDRTSTGLCQVWKSYVVTRPTVSFSWFVFALQMVALFLYPFVYLCVSKNLPGAFLFLVMVLICLEKHLLDPLPVIQEMGTYGSLGTSMEGSTLGDREIASKQEWKSKSRLYHIKSIDNSQSRYFWSRAFYGFLILFFTVLTLAAVTGTKSAPAADTPTGATAVDSDLLDPWITFPSDANFFYTKPQSLSYPRCRFGEGKLRRTDDIIEDQSPSSPIQYLVDYAFLANLPYFKGETLQPLLDAWFGPDKALFEEDAVSTFRTDFPEFAQSYAAFQLISFSDESAIVIVRGTKTFSDYLTDAKLWYSSALFQILRGVLPMGHFFNPLIQFCINLMAALETNSLEKVAYYKETTAFVKYLLGLEKYVKIEITGHSLGGGLALITGAQTHVNAVGLSAPNTVLGRDTVSPRITLEELEKFTLNIVPERDLFPMIGDTSMHVEPLRCRADLSSSLVSCHDAGRSVCEMLYSCGSVARPVFCGCVMNYSYPEPVAVESNGPSFREACL